LSCRTSGNECTSDNQCCSGSCVDDGTGTDTDRCDGAASFCRQEGDICVADYQCCGATCDKADGAAVGTCDPSPAVSGVQSCNIAGILCASETIDDVVIASGCKDCCSALCGPWAPGKPFVCLPASGCRVEGELCSRDEDCCGGDPNNGLPGAGNISCQKADPDDDIGKCRNNNSCVPTGATCKADDTEGLVCSGVSAKSNNCCGATSQVDQDACMVDTTGVPRCNGVADDCREPGETCATAATCCNQLPCIPGDDGILRCLVPEGGTPDGGPTTTCVPQGGTCSFTGDCCQGFFCNLPPGSIQGTCDNPTDPPPPGTPGMDSGTTEPPPPLDCSLFGQACAGSGDCCAGLACSPSLDVCTVGG
jgi:hypothetical protein